jgi:hypothetical protein
VVFQLGLWKRSSERLRVKVDLVRGVEELSCDLRRSCGACIGVHCCVSAMSSHIKLINMQKKSNKIVLLNKYGNCYSKGTAVVGELLQYGNCCSVRTADVWELLLYGNCCSVGTAIMWELL